MEEKRKEGIWTIVQEAPARSEEEREALYREVQRLIRGVRPGIVVPLLKAVEDAIGWHGTQRRVSGELYVFHPVRVARILAGELGIRQDLSVLQAGLLHDVVEDTGVSLEEIRYRYGTDVQELVRGVTKVSRLTRMPYVPTREDLRRLFLALARDLRVVIIKLADRLDNMRTISALSRERQIDIATSTAQVFVPLAHRMGFYRIKQELENITFRILQPEKYAEIQQWIRQRFPRGSVVLLQVLRELEQYLQERGFTFSLERRMKTPASIYRKIQRKKISLEEVYDVLALRVILHLPGSPSLEEEEHACLRVFQAIQQWGRYPLIPERTRIWLGEQKKAGTYEALHCTIRGPGGYPVEIQIRTERMHREAELGIAAHWAYQEGIPWESIRNDLLEKKFRQLREAFARRREILEPLNVNVAEDENQIVVFTPEQEQKILPQGATVLDFAFAIHTNLGLRCIGARVDGQIVPIDYTLKGGEVVEVLVSPRQKPSIRWLEFVRTPGARIRIREYFRRKARETIRKGRAIVREFMVRHGLKLTPLNLKTLSQLLTGTDIYEVLYYLVGAGRVRLSMQSEWSVQDGKLVVSPESARRALLSLIRRGFLRETALAELWSMDAFRRKFAQDRNEEYHGVVKVAHTRKINRKVFVVQRCCHVLPGDDAVVLLQVEGTDRYVVQEVHHISCPRGQQLIQQLGKLVIRARWEPEGDLLFLVSLRVEGRDRRGVIYEISRVIYRELGMSMRAIHVAQKRHLPAHFEGTIDVYVRDRQQLNELMERLKSLPFVERVEASEIQIFQELAEERWDESETTNPIHSNTSSSISSNNNTQDRLVFG